MSKKPITTIALVFALAAGGGASAAQAANNATPTSPGACNMLNTSPTGLAGMMNDRQVFDIMIPLIGASLEGGCTHP
jgi:hypothetical protein